MAPSPAWEGGPLVTVAGRGRLGRGRGALDCGLAAGGRGRAALGGPGARGLRGAGGRGLAARGAAGRGRGRPADADAPRPGLATAEELGGQTDDEEEEVKVTVKTVAGYIKSSMLMYVFVQYLYEFI